MEQKPVYTSQSSGYGEYDGIDKQKSPERQSRSEQEKDAIGDTAVKAAAEAVKESQSTANVNHETIEQAQKLKKLADTLGVSEEYLINAEAAVSDAKKSLHQTADYANETNARLMQIAQLGAGADMMSNTGATYDSMLSAYGSNLGVDERQQIGKRAEGFLRIVDGLNSEHLLLVDDDKKDVQMDETLRRAVEQTGGNPADLPMSFLIETQVENKLREEKRNGRDLTNDEINDLRQEIRQGLHLQMSDDAIFIEGDARRAEEFYDGTSRRIGAVDPGSSNAAKIAFAIFDQDYARKISSLSYGLRELANSSTLDGEAGSDVFKSNSHKEPSDANDEVMRTDTQPEQQKPFSEVLGNYKKEMDSAIKEAKRDAKITDSENGEKLKQNTDKYKTRLRRLQTAYGVIFGDKQLNDPEATLEAKKIVAQMAKEDVSGEDFVDEYLRRYDVALRERKARVARARKREEYYGARKKGDDLPDSSLDELKKWEKNEQLRDLQLDKDFDASDIANYKPTSGYTITPHDDYTKVFGPVSDNLDREPLSQKEIKAAIDEAIAKPEAARARKGILDAKVGSKPADQINDWIQKRDDARDLAKTEGAVFRGVDANGDPIEDNFATADKASLSSKEKRATPAAKEQPTGDPGLASLARGKQGSSQGSSVGESEPKPDYDPMAAISIDRTFDIQQLSRAEAQRRLNQELEDNVEGKGFFGRVKGKLKNMWKGNMARGYYETKYQQEALKKLSGLENIDLQESDIKEKSKTDPRYALVMRLIKNNDAYIRSTAGESRQLIDPAKIDEQLKDGGLSPERRTELENQKKAYESIRSAIEKFSTKDKNGEYLMDESSFDEAMKRADAMLHGDIDDEARATLTNYMAIAKYVRGQAEHGEGVEQVMKGFKLYTAESRANVNGEVKMGKVASAAEKLNKLPFFNKVPPELVAGAASMAANVMPITAKFAARAIPLVGGALVTGALAGAREAANISKDRATLERQLAEGGQNVDAKMSRELAKTMYNMVPASVINKKIDEVIEQGDPHAMKALLTDILVRQEIGDRRGVDLVSYSSADQIDNERMDLTAKTLTLESALIKAMRSDDHYANEPAFNGKEFRAEIQDIVKKMDNMNADDVSAIRRSGKYSVEEKRVARAYEHIFAKDKKFDEVKRKAAMRQGLKAGMYSATVGVAAQELVAIFSPNVHGAFDQLLGNADNAGAHDTMLTGAARHFGLIDQPEAAVPDASVNMNHVETKTIDHDLTPEEIAEYKSQGYDVDKVVNQVHQTVTESVPADQAVQGNADFHRAGWFNNDTTAFDHNELTTYNNGDSMTFDPTRQSWIGSDVLSVDSIRQMGGNGQIRLMLSASDATQGKPFEVVGKLVDGKIQFDPEPGSAAAEMIANRSYKFAEVVDANNMVIGTDIGSGVSGNLPITTDKVVDQISYNLTKVTPEAQPAVETIKTPFDMPSVVPIVFGRRNLRNAIPGQAIDRSAEPGDNGNSPESGNDGSDAPTEVIPSIEDNSDSTGRAEMRMAPNRPLNDNKRAANIVAENANRVTRTGANMRPLTISLDNEVANSGSTNESLSKNGVKTTSTEATSAEEPKQATAGAQLAPNQPEARAANNRESGDALRASIDRGLNDESVRTTEWWLGMASALEGGEISGDDADRLAMAEDASSDNPDLNFFRVHAILAGKLSDDVIDQLSHGNNEFVQRSAINSGRLSRRRLEEIVGSNSDVSPAAQESIDKNNYIE